jgi:hypothetical protein
VDFPIEKGSYVSLPEGTNDFSQSTPKLGSCSSTASHMTLESWSSTMMESWGDKRGKNEKVSGELTESILF